MWVELWLVDIETTGRFRVLGSGWGTVAAGSRGILGFVFWPSYILSFSWPSKSIFLMFAIPSAGLRPLGQTVEQLKMDLHL